MPFDVCFEATLVSSLGDSFHEEIARIMKAGWVFFHLAFVEDEKGQAASLCKRKTDRYFTHFP